MPAILHGPSDSDFVRLASMLVIALIVVMSAVVLIVLTKG